MTQWRFRLKSEEVVKGQPGNSQRMMPRPQCTPLTWPLSAVAVCVLKLHSLQQNFFSPCEAFTWRSMPSWVSSRKAHT